VLATVAPGRAVLLRAAQQLGVESERLAIKAVSGTLLDLTSAIDEVN